MQYLNLEDSEYIDSLIKNNHQKYYRITNK